MPVDFAELADCVSVAHLSSYSKIMPYCFIQEAFYSSVYVFLTVLTWELVDTLPGQRYAEGDWLSTWADADRVCANNSAALATITTPEENLALSRRFPTTFST